MPLPIDEAGFGVDHGVDDELDEAAVVDASLFPGVVIADDVSDLTLAVGARRTQCS